MSAVMLTAAGKFVFMDYLNWRFAFAATVIVAWSVYIIFRYRNEKEILTYWGLFHGWLGGLFYYTVVGRDPFLEMFNKIFHLSN